MMIPMLEINNKEYSDKMRQLSTPIRKEHNGKPHIKVYLRTRPLLEKEILEGAENILKVISVENKVLVEEGSKGCFVFDGVCDENESQEEVFDKVVYPLLKNLESIKNVNVIAYGQTGSGKTYTIGTNPVYSQENGGMLQRVMSSLLQKETLENAPEKYLKMTFLEIYNENIYDLFASRKILETKADGFGGVIPLNCIEEIILTSEEGLTLLEKGNNLRSVASTIMNSHSSRSHAVISVTLYEKLVNGVSVPKGCLRMVDLAGAEGVGRNNTEKKNFCEGVSINKGLLAVGKVLAALSTNSASLHIPYRESIVTRLLRDALSGTDCSTAMIVCVNPASTNLSVTLNTLRYAEQARNIKIKHKPSTAKKRKSFKRRFDDLSAHPAAWKKFASEKKRTPSHNSTISTPGHKPSIRRVQPLNTTFATPLNRDSSMRRPFPRSSSRTDLKSISEFASFKQPTFDDEISPTSTIIGGPSVNTTFFQMSPLVEKMNSRFEQSILQYEQRMENKMKSMESQLARKVAKMIIKGTKSKRRSRRLIRKKDKSEFLTPTLKDKSSNLSLNSSNDENNCNISNNIEESPFSLADSIAEALLRKKNFRSAIKVAVKEGKEVNSAKEENFMFDSNHTRLPLSEISNINESTSNKSYVHKNHKQQDRMPVTSTVACIEKFVRRSTRLSCQNTEKRFSFLPSMETPKTSNCVKNETCESDEKFSNSDVMVLFTSDYLTSASPVLPNNTVICNQAKQDLSSLTEICSSSGKSCLSTRRRSARTANLNALKAVNGTCGFNEKLPNNDETLIFSKDYLTSASPALRNNKICNKGNETLNNMTELSPTNKSCLNTRRRSTRRSALHALKAIKLNCEALSANSPSTTASRIKSTKSKDSNKSLNNSIYFAGLKTPMKCKENLELTVNFSAQKEHSEHILHLLNNADLRKLQTLPTIGPKTAMVIYNFRKMFGKLKAVEDLQSIPGLTKSFYTRFIKANLVLR